MDAILDFLADYYIYFMIAAGLLLVALIGFIVDGKKKKNKGGEVPAATADINQATAALSEAQVSPAQPVEPQQPTEPEPALVFEQPSLTENETMKELGEIGMEPSLSFENTEAEKSEPVNFNQPSAETTNETVTIGQPIEAPALGQVPVIGDSAVTDLPIVETPGVDLPIIEEPVDAAPVMEIPTVDTTPVVETPVAEVTPVETPVVEVPAVEIINTEVPVSTVETPSVVEPVEILDTAVPTPTTETPVMESQVAETPVVSAPAVSTDNTPIV